MDQRLKDYEDRRLAARLSAPDLEREISAAHARLGLKPSIESALVIRKIITKLAEDAGRRQPEYHNLHHVQDVVDAAALLLSTNVGMVGADQCELLLVAALGHDLHHDGSGPLSEPLLEWRSANAVTEAGLSCGLRESALKLVESLIVSTYPPMQMSLRSGVAGDAGSDPILRLELILGEADVLASLTPRLGRELSLCLDREWEAAGVEAAWRPSSPEGRRQFLTAYQVLSAEALSLGVDAMIAEQLNRGADESA